MCFLAERRKDSEGELSAANQAAEEGSEGRVRRRGDGGRGRKPPVPTTSDAFKRRQSPDGD